MEGHRSTGQNPQWAVVPMEEEKEEEEEEEEEDDDDDDDDDDEAWENSSLWRMKTVMSKVIKNDTFSKFKVQSTIAYDTFFCIITT